MENENQTETAGKMKQWLQDNLRIIVSIIIVVAIAGGIYSYSKRTEAPVKDEISQESILSEEMQEDSSATEVDDAAQVAMSSTPQSQETEESFVVMAAKGNGTTHLARKALADYLEKNPDEALAPEHKIYIEDYLRKMVGPKSLEVGTSVEFSKNLIQDAIAQAKTLNENQVNNLHKYAVRVPSLK